MKTNKIDTTILFLGLGLLWLSKIKKKSPTVGKLRATSFIPVYDQIPTRNKKGKTNLRQFTGKHGVYLIKENGKIVYVGHSKSNLYRTIIRHFHQWNDHQYRVSYSNKLKRNKYTVRVVLLDKRRIDLLEAALIEKYQPRDNIRPEQTTLDFFPIEKLDFLDQYENAPKIEIDLNESVPF